MYVAADQAKKGVSDGGSSLQSKPVSTGFGKNGTAGKRNCETARHQSQEASDKIRECSLCVHKYKCRMEWLISPQDLGMH